MNHISRLSFIFLGFVYCCACIYVLCVFVLLGAKLEKNRKTQKGQKYFPFSFAFPFVLLSFPFFSFFLVFKAK